MVITFKKMKKPENLVLKTVDYKLEFLHKKYKKYYQK